MSAALSGSGVDREFRSRLVRWIARAHHGTVEAEDLFQEAFVRYEQCRRHGTLVNPTGFLLRAATNCAIDAYRKRRYLSAQPFEIACRAHVDPTPAIDEILTARDRLGRVLQGLERLGARTREVFLMHRLDGHKHQQIAAALGISRSAVEKHIAKADAFLVSWAEGW
jgi:RNA polymerase sigma factor (sigma-70 family)